ncbi:MAG: hypothetical protein QG610_771, partial [Euryarchaeota archaeon]|nr:hypothetical protein [Euryarchaeota archaeon]
MIKNKLQKKKSGNKEETDMVLGYMYVLKQIVEVEKKGNLSFNEISGHLKMST